MEIATIADLRARAKRRLPRFVFDYLDGGVGPEHGVRRNEAALDAVTLLPRYLVNVERRDLATPLFGRGWTAPFGVAPIGLANLIWPGADAAIAAAARAAGVPATVATAASTSLEDFRAAAGSSGWYMLYPGRSEEVVDDLTDRAAAAGYEVLVVTVDVPLASIRPRERRNGFSTPLRYTPRLVADVASHPRWALATLRHGPPRFANMERYVARRSTDAQAAYLGAQTTGRSDWTALERLRGRWRGTMAVKGILSPEDAVRARAIGCDAVIVSNHGGRQLDAAPATAEALPAIRAALGPDFPVLLDGGVRSGEHVAKAIALGADFVLCGRAVMYGLGALGREGAAAALAMLRDEFDRCLGQLGCTDTAALRRSAPLFVRR